MVAVGMDPNFACLFTLYNNIKQLKEGQHCFKLISKMFIFLIKFLDSNYHMDNIFYE